MRAERDRQRDAGAQRRHAFLFAIAPPKFALAGISMGGYICFEILRQAPERVLKLGLLDTNARPDLPETSEVRRAQVAEARQGGLRDVVARSFPTWVHPKRRADQGLLDIAYLMADEVGVEGFARQQQANIDRIDSRPSLSSIRCPTLVLVGEQDQLTPPDRAKEIADGIAGARLVTVPECGHSCTWEQPGKVVAALSELLRQ